MATDVLSKIIAAEEAKKKALRGLHRELGYASAQALAEAILEASASDTASMPKAPKRANAAKGAKAPKAKSGKGAGRGRRIADEVRTGIIAALEAGEPGNQLTSKFGVSYGVIHAIKTSLGLVKKQSRGKSGRKKGTSKKGRKKASAAASQ